MRKEVGYAIFAGIILGLIVAFGVYRINSEVSKNKKVANVKVSPTPTPSPIGPKDLKIVLDKPNQNEVVTESTVTVTGLTKPSLWVIVSGENRDYLTQANASGGFTQDVDLIAGVNQIKVTAFTLEGNKANSDTLVVYSSSFVEKGSENATNKDSSDSADIQKRVAENLARTIEQPKAFIGTVTDVTGSTLELKSRKGEIEQVSIGTQTQSVVNSVGTTTKTVKVSDIAIGDFIVAMGYVQANSVLSAQRILITNSITDPSITIGMAKVTDTGRNTIDTSLLPDNKPTAITLTSKTRLETFKEAKAISIKLASVSDTDTVIYTQTLDAKEQPVTRSVFLVPQN